MTEEVKEAMAGDLGKSLMDERLCFAREFITGKLVEKGKDNVAEIQKEYCKQLENFRLELIMPNDIATGKAKKCFTGKTSGGKKDDMIVCSMIALYYSGKKRCEIGFMKLAHQRGWRY